MDGSKAPGVVLDYHIFERKEDVVVPFFLLLSGLSGAAAADGLPPSRAT